MKQSLLLNDLKSQKKKLRKSEEEIINQVRQILYQSQFSDKNILKHLRKYNEKFELVNDDECSSEGIFTMDEIKMTCIRYGLKFLPSNFYLNDFPYEVILKVKHLNETQKKNLKHFFIISDENAFNKKKTEASIENECLLFCKTEMGNYYLIHRWGKPYKRNQLIKAFPLRSFESLFLCVIGLSLLITLSLPNHLITNDSKAEYFSMYRIACFFHVLIINIGFTVFSFLGFNKRFSEQNFEEYKKVRNN